ncbi:UNVERIFIED_CONTAM: hypothetical protein GTU68_024735, partial [Idotea baltica]|nr:hypothetical protein [Idotea baltica]
MNQISNLSADEIKKGISNKDFKATEVIGSALEKINSTKNINSYISVFEEDALKEAKRIDSENLDVNDFPLLGVPIAVKDVILSKNQKATCASKMLSNFISPYDAHVVENLKKAGAIIVGKTNLDEFCMGSSGEHSFFGATKNPWKEDRVPGGTSSGSAAAVASGTVPISLGTDTGGSIRQPASYCGLIGLKPTYGRVSRYGVIAYASSLDQVGCFSRNTLDCAVLLNAISGHDMRDATSVDKTNWDFHKSIDNFQTNLKIGLPKEYFLSDGLQPEVKEKLNECIKYFESVGAEFIEIDLPNTDIALSAYY